MNQYDPNQYENFVFSFAEDLFCVPVTVKSFPESTKCFAEEGNYNSPVFIKMLPFSLWVNKRHLEDDSSPLVQWIAESLDLEKSSDQTMKCVRLSKADVNTVGVIVEIVALSCNWTFHETNVVSVSICEESEDIEIVIQTSQTEMF